MPPSKNLPFRLTKQIVSLRDKQYWAFRKGMVKKEESTVESERKKIHFCPLLNLPDDLIEYMLFYCGLSPFDLAMFSESCQKIRLVLKQKAYAITMDLACSKDGYFGLSRSNMLGLWKTSFWCSWVRMGLYFLRLVKSMRFENGIITAGKNHTIVLKKCGSIVGFGSNEKRQLGFSEVNEVWEPRTLEGFKRNQSGSSLCGRKSHSHFGRHWVCLWDG